MSLGIDAEVVAADDRDGLTVDRERAAALEHDVHLLVAGLDLVVLDALEPAGSRTSLIPNAVVPSARRILKKTSRNDSIDGSSRLTSVYPMRRNRIASSAARAALDRRPPSARASRESAPPCR